jgi:nucleoside-diphosphate-sugar epimerase
MKVSITGATGFIGKKLAELQLAQGHTVNCLSRKKKVGTLGTTFFEGTLGKESPELSSFLDNADVLFNCAGELKNNLLMQDTHVNGVKNLLKIIQQGRTDTSPKLFHWVQLSSCGAYGNLRSSPQAPRYIDENTPSNPVGEYECTKTKADELIIDFAHKHDWFKYTIIRPTIVFGSEMNSSLILRIAKTIKKNIFFYIGHKKAIVNFVHVDDVINAMSLSALNTKAYNQIFIVSNDCKLVDLIDVVATTINRPKPNLTINEKLIRNTVAIANKFVKLPINQFQIDVLTRQTYYSSQKILDTINWSPSRPVLIQLESYIMESMN